MPPRETAPTPYPELAPGGWTVEKIRTAITSLEQGYLGPASRLARALSRHPRYVQGREQFIGAVQGCPLDVLAAPLSYGGVGTARGLAEQGGPVLAGVLRDGAERWLIEYGRVLPLVVGVLSWDLTTRPWRPVSLSRWPLEAVRVDLGARRLYAVLSDGREEEIVAGNGTWVVGWAEGAFNFAGGLLRCFAEPWIRGINAGRDVANRSQSSAVAALAAVAPEGEEMESTRVVSVEQKIQDLQKGGPAGIVLPPGWKVPETIDLATKNAAEVLDLSLRTSTTDLLVPWLLQDGTATNEGGSLAKAQVLDGVLYSAVAATVRWLWGEVAVDGTVWPGLLTDQILRPWVRYQLAPEVDGLDADRLCPLAIRRVPDLEEDARLAEEGRRAGAFWTEVGATEGAMRRDLTEKELKELAGMRGVRVPATALRERGARPAPVGSAGAAGDPP